MSNFKGKRWGGMRRKEGTSFGLKVTAITDVFVHTVHRHLVKSARGRGLIRWSSRVVEDEDFS